MILVPNDPNEPRSEPYIRPNEPRMIIREKGVVQLLCRASAWTVLKGRAKIFTISKIIDFGEFEANFHDT